MERAAIPVRKLRLSESGADRWARGLTAAERVAVVWQLSLQAWSFKEGLVDEPRLRRDVVRTLRGGRGRPKDPADIALLEELA
jgi:hypothetical protein